MKILSLDPATGETGWAVLTDDGSPDGRLDDYGLIRGADGELEHVMRELYCSALALIASHLPDVAAVELPFAQKRPGGQARRSVVHLPTYGMAVGVCLAACYAHTRSVYGVPNDEWGRRFPVGKDQYKTARVLAVEGLYGLERGKMGAMSVAGNVADAVLLARYVLLRHVRTDGVYTGGRA